jgi:hypothetical protein
MMTKRAVRAQRAAWRAALADGRVVHLGTELRAYPTRDAAERGMAEARAAGLPARVVIDRLTTAGTA